MLARIGLGIGTWTRQGPDATQKAAKKYRVVG
jgi:hypothetical protein